MLKISVSCHDVQVVHATDDGANALSRLDEWDPTDARQNSKQDIGKNICLDSADWKVSVIAAAPVDQNQQGSDVTWDHSNDHWNISMCHSWNFNFR